MDTNGTTTSWWRRLSAACSGWATSGAGDGNANDDRQHLWLLPGDVVHPAATPARTGAGASIA